MYCSNCKKEIPDSSRFCEFCGSKIVSKTQGSYAETVTSGKWINEKKTRNIIILGGISFIVLVTLVIILSSIAETNNLKKAMNLNDGYNTYMVYSQALGNNSKLRKYNEVISEKLEEITKDLKKYDFDSDALTNGNKAVDNWAKNQWGTLIYSNNYTLRDCLQSDNMSKWNKLMEEIENKRNYCQGLYYFKTQNDPQKAIELFGKSNENSDILNECISEYIKLILIQVDEKVAANDINTGIELLKSAGTYLNKCGASSQEITDKINSVYVSYADSYVKKAETAFTENNIDSAIANMEVAFELQPQNAEYKAKLDNYKLYLPFALYKNDNVLNVTWNNSCSSIFDQDPIIGNDNKEYKNIIDIYHSSYCNKKTIVDATYNLAGKYDTVSGKILLDQKNKNSKQDGYFEAYGDGKLIYTSPKIFPGELPKDISFSVSGIQKLEIKFLGTLDENSWSASYYVSNLIAQKSVA